MCQLRCFCCGNGSGVKEHASSWTARAVVSSKLFPIDGSYGGEFRSFASYLRLETGLQDFSDLRDCFEISLILTILRVCLKIGVILVCIPARSVGIFPRNRCPFWNDGAYNYMKEKVTCERLKMKKKSTNPRRGSRLSMECSANEVKPGVEAKVDMAVRVGVGYGWMKVEEGVVDNGRAVLSDVFWNTLKDAFVPKHSAIDKIGARVSFSRLRASHGRIIWTSVLEGIANSDILIFDVAAAPKSIDKDDGDFDLGRIMLEMSKDNNLFNANVLIEIGAAIALGKRIMLLCPDAWGKFVPSDLKGYLWTFYKWSGVGKNTKRIFVDQYGMQNGYIGMLREVVNERLGSEE